MPSHYWTPERKEKWIAEQLRNIEDPIQRAIFLNKLYTDGTISQIEQEKETMRISKIDEEKREEEEKEARLLQKEIAREQRAEAKTLRLREEQRAYEEGKAKTAAEKKAEEARRKAEKKAEEDRIKAEEDRIKAEEKEIQKKEDTIRNLTPFKTFEDIYEEERKSKTQQLAKLEDEDKLRDRILKDRLNLKDLNIKKTEEGFINKKIVPTYFVDGQLVDPKKYKKEKALNELAQRGIERNEERLKAIIKTKQMLQDQLKNAPPASILDESINYNLDTLKDTDIMKSATRKYQEQIRRRILPSDVPTPQF
jgi:hypothetical protein